MKVDHYEYRILDHFLPYLINGDATGLTEEELDLVQEWETEQIKNAEQNFPTLHNTHWSCLSLDHFLDRTYGICEITGCFGNLAEIQLIVLYN